MNNLHIVLIIIVLIILAITYYLYNKDTRLRRTEYNKESISDNLKAFNNSQLHEIIEKLLESEISTKDDEEILSQKLALIRQQIALNNDKTSYLQEQLNNK